MTFDPTRHHRRSIRLRGYDYSRPGAYFVTICAFSKQCLFGEIVDGKMRRNAIGELVHAEWFRSSAVRKEMQLDDFVVMPNHVHGIVRIVGADGVRPLGAGTAGNGGAHGMGPGGTRRVPLRRRRSLASFVAGFKSVATRRINESRTTPQTPVWQRNYYEHVIRSEDALNRIREYICRNPVTWPYDRENPARVGRLSDELEEILEGDFGSIDDGW